MGRWLHGADAELTASKACVCQSQLSCEVTLLLLVGIRVTTGSSPEKSKVPLYDITPITRQGALVRAGSMELRWHFLQIPRGSQSRFLPPPTGGYVEREYVSALLQLNLKTEASATTPHSRLKAVGRSCPLRPMPAEVVWVTSATSCVDERILTVNVQIQRYNDGSLVTPFTPTTRKVPQVSCHPEPAIHSVAAGCLPRAPCAGRHGARARVLTDQVRAALRRSQLSLLAAWTPRLTAILVHLPTSSSCSMRQPNLPFRYAAVAYQVIPLGQPDRHSRPDRVKSTSWHRSSALANCWR